MKTLTARIALCLAMFGSAAVLGASPAQAGGDPSARAAKLCAELACTPTQQEKITQLKVVKAPQMKAARENMKALKQQRRAEAEKSNPDASVLARLDTQIEAAKATKMAAREAMKREISALLTAEQRAKFQAHMDRKAQAKHGHGKHGKGDKGEFRGKQRHG